MSEDQFESPSEDPEAQAAVAEAERIFAAKRHESSTFPPLYQAAEKQEYTELDQRMKEAEKIRRYVQRATQYYLDNPNNQVKMRRDSDGNFFFAFDKANKSVDVQYNLETAAVVGNIIETIGDKVTAYRINFEPSRLDVRRPLHPPSPFILEVIATKDGISTRQDFGVQPTHVDPAHPLAYLARTADALSPSCAKTLGEVHSIINFLLPMKAMS